MSSVYTVSIQDRSGAWRTPDVSDVRFTKSVNGNTTCQFTVDDAMPLVGVGPDCKVRVSNRHGHTMWTGVVGIPGAAKSGQWDGGADIGCTGNLATLSAATFPFPYLVTRLDAWERDPQHTSRYDSETQSGSRSESPSLNGLILSFPQGQMFKWDRARMRFLPFIRNAGWAVGGIAGSVNTGIASPTQWWTRAYLGDAAFDHRLLDVHPSTSGVAFNKVVPGTSDLPYDEPSLSVEWRYDGDQATLGGDGGWAMFYNLTVAAQRYAAIGGGVKQPFVNAAVATPSDIVADVMARLLRDLVNVGVSVWEGSTAILESLDYSDSPATIAELLDDLATIEGDWLWRWGNEDTEGRADLRFMPWPTNPRYFIPGANGVVAQEDSTSDVSLYDRVTVRWDGVTGNPHASTYIADRMRYTDLERMPATGRAYPDVDLGKRTTAPATVDRIGNAILDVVARRPDSVKVTIPAGVDVIDLASGAVIEPDSIHPGEVVHIQSLGRSVRCTQMDADEGAARLECGMRRRETAQIIDDALRRRKRR